ncbi:MAG: hypothetical protein ACR2NU_07440 [Aeoliella sp.]
MRAWRMLLLVVALIWTITLCASAAEQDEQSSGKWRPYVIACLDTLIERGTDVYGPVKTPMLMSILDVRSLESPEEPELYDDFYRTEGRPDHGRRSPGGSNLWLDQPLIKTMYECSKATSNDKYSRAADAYVQATFEHAFMAAGLLGWGSHTYYHAHQDKLAGDGQHEILIIHPTWTDMYRVNPLAVCKEIDNIWEQHIVDKETGAHDRHNNHSSLKADFCYSGGSFALAFAFMHKATGEQEYIDKAKLVANWHYEHRNEETGLVRDAPLLGDGYGANHCQTAVAGPFASQMLRCYELTGDERFLEVGVGCIRSYARYAWDEEARSYWSLLTVDGKRIPQQPPKSDKHPEDYWLPTGHVDVWRTVMYTWEFPLIAAQASIYAYELTEEAHRSKDEELITIARQWGEVIEKNSPPYLGRRWKQELEKGFPEISESGGTYAENYGRAISFFVHLYQATGDQKYLILAEQLAQEAVDKLYVEVDLDGVDGDTTYGIFRGHPAKPYYQSNDFVGILLYALLELDTPSQHFRGAF